MIPKGAPTMIKINEAHYFKKEGVVRPTGYIATQVKALDGMLVTDAG